MAEILEEMEAAQSEPRAVEKQLNGKYVNVGSGRTAKAGHVRNSEWQWLALARSRYSEEQREVAKAYAEEE